MYDTDSFKKDIQDNYDIEEELGSGQFAVVRKIVEKETGDEFAGKYVRKKRTKASRNGMSREDIKREIEILRLVDHEKIIKVHDVYETDREMILVMELLRGGELFDYISKKDFLTEEEAIDFTRQILQGLQHLHSLSVVHLDLKPENILLKNVRRKTIKLVDFGLARVVKENEQVREIMGTPEFVAPEVLNFDTISTATDMWALGVIAYILLSGASPFLGEDNQETFTNIIQVDYQFDEEYFSEISDEAKDFIRKLLVKDPRKRPTAHECSRHTWVEEEVVDKKKRQRRRTTQICTFNFKRFVARKRWKMSFNKVRAMNLIAKMGIKPPPGFITVIPPMPENDVSVQDKVEEKPSHKERKKNTSTINRRKHKQHSSPKATLEKTDSFTLKTMDIDIGETETAGSGSDVVPSDYEDLKEVESSAPVSEPDYATMSLREKRRARGQLRHHEIVKSKEIDAKKIDDQSDTSAVQENPETATPMKRDDKESREEVEPETRTVSSTMHIEHKPAGRTVSGGILKKRETKGARIPSTEDHYYVSLNAALFEQKDPFSPAEEKPQWSAKHGILKHDNKKTSEEKPVKISKVHQEVRGTKNIAPAEATAGINVDVEIARAPEPENVSPIGEPEVEKIQDSEMEKADKEVDNESQPSEPMNVEPSDSSNIVTKGSDSVGADSVGKSNPKGRLANKNATPSSLVKKSVQSSERVQQQQQQRFSPPPWKTHKSGNEHQKSSQKPLHSVSKVSLKTNRFLANEKQSRPKSPTSTNGLKTSIVLGRAKLFQKESVPAKNSQNFMKTVATKTNSAGDEYKAVSCDINLDEPVKSKDISEKNDSDERSKKGKEIREKDFQHTKHGVKSKASSDSQSKIRSESLEDSTNNNKTTNVSTNRSRSGTARDSAGKALSETKVDNTDPGETELVVYASDIPAADQMKALVNGETAGSEIELSRGEDVDTEKDVTEPMAELSVEEMEEEQAKEELKSTSTHSLTEFTIRPRQNSGEGSGGGFDVLLTIGPQDEQQKSDQRLTSIKSRFTSSSSSALSDKIGVPNGKLLMSSSAVDVTNHSRSTAQVTFQTGDRHNFAQGPKYTPQRDFSKYLTPDQHDKKPTQTSGLSSNNPKTTSSHRQPQPIVVNRPPSKTPVTKGKKQTVSTVYVPRRTFGYTAKPDNQTEHVSQPHSVANDTPKENKNDQSKRWSQSSSTSDRSADSVSSEESRECSVADAKLGNNVHIDSSGVRVYKAEKLANNNSTNINISQKFDNHPSPNPSPHASPVLERKWKATLVLPNKDSEKISSAKERDIRISSSNVPRRNKFTNVRSMWEGK